MLVKGISPLVLVELANLYERDLAQPIAPARMKAEVTLAQATPGDVPALATLAAQDHHVGADRIPFLAEALARRFERGERCFIARAGSQIVHYNWLSFGWKESLAGRYIVVQDDAAYCGWAYTEEGWRGRSIHAGVHAMMLRHLQASGFRRAYTWAHVHNRASRATIERMGWTRTGVMLAFTPAGGASPLVWCVRGRLEPFAERDLPR